MWRSSTFFALAALFLVETCFFPGCYTHSIILESEFNSGSPKPEQTIRVVIMPIPSHLFAPLDLEISDSKRSRKTSPIGMGYLRSRNVDQNAEMIKRS